LNFTETRESGFLRFWHPEISPPPVRARLLAMIDKDDTGCLNVSRREQARAYRVIGIPIKTKSNPQGAFEKQYRLSLLQVFAMRQ
jgi:hypothetical protein